MKLYTNRLDHFFFYNPRIIADATNTHVEVVVVSEETAATPEFKTKKAHGNFPFLELENGTTIFESNAIASFIARSAGANTLFGNSAFE
jgi:glutathione S-transferase